MISKKDIQIISHLRKNAREKITDIARETHIPVTTIYDKVRMHDKGLFKRHVSLLDFSKLGYSIMSMIAVKAEKNKRFNLRDYLYNHKNVNSLYRVNEGFDFVLGCVFENSAQAEDFLDSLKAEHNVKEAMMFNVIDEVKKEGFLTHEGDILVN